MFNDLKTNKNCNVIVTAFFLLAKCSIKNLHYCSAPLKNPPKNCNNCNISISIIKQIPLMLLKGSALSLI